MLAGVAAVLAVEYVLRDRLVPGLGGESTIRVAIGVEWLLVAALVLFWVPRVERSTWRAIGIGAWRHRYLWLGAAWFLAATVASAVVGAALGAVGLDSLSDLQPGLAGYAWPTLLGLAVTGAVVEEILYRGYLIERVSALSGRMWVAAGVSWLAFTAVHLGFFGIGATLNAAVLSAALVWLYVRERSIWPVVVVHGLNSGFAYLLVPLLF
jgi:membrane protease YdiL (CAAX protease family)